MASNVSEFIIETTTKEYGSLEDVHDCVKNPGHVGFYSLDDLTVDILPEECKTEKWLKFILDFSKRIVRIIINKPDGGKLYGTGCVFMWHDDDSDSDIFYSDSDFDSDLDIDSYKFYIRTNEHVIGSQEDVRNCIVDWFYDTEDRAGVESSCGGELLDCDKEHDYCWFSVDYIPETVKQLLYQPPDRPPVTDLQHIIAIAHPHGAPKTVTFGKRLGGEIVDGLFRDIHTAKTCGGSSGTRLICTKFVDSLYWTYSRLTHYAGQRGNAYNIKDHDGTVIKQVTSDTNNINYSMWGWRF